MQLIPQRLQNSFHIHVVLFQLSFPDFLNHRHIENQDCQSKRHVYSALCNKVEKSKKSRIDMEQSHTKCHNQRDFSCDSMSALFDAGCHRNFAVNRCQINLRSVFIDYFVSNRVTMYNSFFCVFLF